MPSQEDKTVRLAFGRVVRALRQNGGISQEELGERAGLHRTYISMVERGIKTPTVVTLVDLAGALGMSTGRLMALFDEELTAGSLAAEEPVPDRARRATGREAASG